METTDYPQNAPMSEPIGRLTVMLAGLCFIVDGTLAICSLGVYGPPLLILTRWTLEKLTRTR